MPDDYYVSQYSGEEIDALLGKAGSSVQVACNPNLLDNWYFGNPVNQRGQTEYTTVGYTVDRWLIGAGSNGTLLLTGSGLNLARTDGIMYLAHRIPKTQIPEGSLLTYSVLTTSGLFSINFVAKNDTYHEQVVGGGISLGWNYTPAEMMELTLANSTVNSDVTVLAAKLELGDQQTLAHKDAAGNWALNEIPDYGEQLRRCQRYFYRAFYVQYHTINMAYEDTAYSFLMLPLPVEMRIKNPVVTQSAPIALGTSEKILPTAEVSGCMARLAVNYDAISNPVRSCYAYCPHAEGVTFTLSADL